MFNDRIILDGLKNIIARLDNFDGNFIRAEKQRHTINTELQNFKLPELKEKQLIGIDGKLEELSSRTLRLEESVTYLHVVLTDTNIRLDSFSNRLTELKLMMKELIDKTRVNN